MFLLICQLQRYCFFLNYTIIVRLTSCFFNKKYYSYKGISTIEKWGCVKMQIRDLTTFNL